MNRSWRKSTYSSDSAWCVEVFAGQQNIGIRDSKTPGPELWVTPDAFRELIADLREGRLSTPPA